MPGKSRRNFDDMDKQALLDALEAARRACVQAGRKAPVQGDVFVSVEKVMDAIDGATLTLTGQRDHFWLKEH